MIAKKDVRLVSNETIIIRINGRIKNKVIQFAMSENMKISQYIKGLIYQDLKSNGFEIDIQETIALQKENL